MTAVDLRAASARVSNGTRVPVHNLDAERALLGAALLAADVADRVGGHVTTADFYDVGHSRIWDAIIRLRCRGESTDPITVAAELRAAGTPLDNPAELTVLQGETPAISGAASFARIVADNAFLRRMEAAAGEIDRLAHNPGPDIHAAASRAHDVLADTLTGRGLSVGDPDPDLATFLEGDDDAYDWIVSELLERGDRIMVTGSEGAGKSTWVRQVAVQVAAGVHPVTLDDIPPQRVFLLDLENSVRQTRRKMRPLRAKVAARLAPDMLRVHCRPAGVDLCRPADLAWLHERLAVNRPALFITGPIYKMGRGNWLDEEVAQGMALALDELRTEHGCAVLLEAHQPKASGASAVRALGPIGSSVWLRWPEFGINLDAPPGSSIATVRHWRGQRDERRWPATLKRGEWKQSAEWPWIPSVDALDPVEVSGPLEEAKTRIAGLLAELAPSEQTLNAIRRKLTAVGQGVRAEMARPAADSLVHDGVLTVRGGTGGHQLYRWVPDEDF